MALALSCQSQLTCTNLTYFIKLSLKRELQVMSVPVKSSLLKEEIEDPVEHMLKKTGCIELHYQVQECFAETQDWRKCQTQVKQFKKCMDLHRQKQEESYKF